jgi:protein-S-isoprenylcysteine O-methyltransferase Ste14
MLKVIVFAVVSAGIVVVSWASFRDPHSHGFWRFFAFESFLLLTLLNIDVWFRDPFSALQIVSWLLLLSSFILAAHGFYLLQRIGKPKGGVENTTTLVMQGAYKYIRHPLYSTLLLGGCGVFFQDPSLLAGTLFLATSIFVFATAKTEESENLKKFGADYAAYIKTTKMFIPFLF